MTSSPDPTIAERNGPSALLEGFGRGEQRGRSLRAQLTARFPDRPADEIEDAVQTACRFFLDEAEGITDPVQVFAWLRTAANRALLRELGHQAREVAVDPTDFGRAEALAEEAGPAEELIALEDEADLEILVREVADSLSEHRREILALWAAGLNRPEIASRLGVGERSVKRDLTAIMDEARVVLARESGGGCVFGEPLVLRFIYGLASSAEVAQARGHLDRCGRCAALGERLEAWRDKAGALLPLPAAEAANSGVFERIVHRGSHAVASLRQQILGGAQAKQQAVVSAYSRAADPTPLAGIKPGAVAAVVAGCIAVGGGATYCAQHGVDPLGAATGLIAGTQESEPPSSSTSPQASEPAPVVMPPPAEEPPPAEATETPPPAETAPAPEPAPEPEPEPEPPPAEASFEPSAPVEPTTESETAEPATEAEPSVSEKPAPAQSGPQFGGP